MKSLIVLAIAVHLVSVQGSRIIQQDLDYEQLDDDGRDYISVDSSDAILAEIQDMGTLEDASLEKREDSFKCHGTTCQFCVWKLCMGVTHLPGTKTLKVHATAFGHNVFDQEIQAKPWTRCKKLNFFLFHSTGCITLSDMRIENSKICTTPTLSASPYGHHEFNSVCV